MLHFSKSVLMKKQTHLHLGWTGSEYVFSKFKVLCQLFFYLFPPITVLTLVTNLLHIFIHDTLTVLIVFV